MPEYLAPGVYVEEVSFRAKSIEGVSTTTTAFIGPTRYGPTDLEPEIVTSLGEFEQMYGDRQPLNFTEVDEGSGNTTELPPMHNFMWHAARAFFEEGGKRLYVVRAFKPIGDFDDGCANAWLTSTGARPTTNAEVRRNIEIRARFPGDLGRTRVRLTLFLSQNVLGRQPDPAHPGQFRNTVNGLLPGDVVWISDVPGSPPTDPNSERGDFYLAEADVDPDTKETTWRFTNVRAVGTVNPPATRNLIDLLPNADPTRSDKIRIVTLTVTVIPTGESDRPPLVVPGLPLDPGHTRSGQPDSVFDYFAAHPSSLARARRLPVVIERGRAAHNDASDPGGTDIVNGIDVLDALFTFKSALASFLSDLGSGEADRSIDLLLDGGNDGQRPTAAEYEGEAPPNESFKTGLKVLEDLDDVSIVAAPGSTFGVENGYRDDAMTIVSHLIAHAQLMRYRIAVLDAGDGQTIQQIRAMRAQFDSSYAALYYPWVRILDPVTQREVSMPPSGFVSGIYARNDINRAVYKAPANEVVNLALGFETMLNKSQQEVLNPEGINCFRFFEGRGYRLWGARTISSDPEWKYVNLRRYFAYLEHSIDKGTQWAVFEPNGEQLWANVRRTIEDFLLNEWQNGALLGDKPEKAYFVKCDRSTMTQNDLDSGRLVCLIGVVALKPAEFVIFRIGQWTADRKV